MKRKKIQHVKPRLQAFLDGELTDKEARAVATHCRTCSSCRGVLEELEALAGAMRSDTAPEPLRPMWPEVRARLKGGPQPRFRLAFAFAASTLAAAGFLLGLLIGMTNGPSRTAGSGDVWSEIATTLTDNHSGTFADVYLASLSEEGGRSR